jgi:hypothetical protein
MSLDIFGKRFKSICNSILLHPLQRIYKGCDRGLPSIITLPPEQSLVRLLPQLSPILVLNLSYVTVDLSGIFWRGIWHQRQVLPSIANVSSDVSEDTQYMVF